MLKPKVTISGRLGNSSGEWIFLSLNGKTLTRLTRKTLFRVSHY